ncbi:uncharacterized protein LOC115241977 [Formica exsecta]|uniref:uncharacterized protein LOC115241977 n=1 Tax=Formica exsecta TaxID=72781 RepID=UPI001144EEAE|nr:uncharacterized protein LOC115241977 [Formica exsecta]
MDDFRNDLSSRDWNSLLCAQDVNHKICILNNFLLECYDKHAPLKNIKPRHLPAPWLIEDIRAAMRERDRARRVWRRRRTTANYSAYKTMRNGVQVAVRDAKRDCYCSALHNIKDPNDIWKKLRHLGLMKPKSSNLMLLFSIEELNDHFLHNARAAEVLDNVHLGDQSYDDTKFYWHNIETQMVARALARNKSGAVGIDGLTSKLISLALPCILPFVTHIYNYCISNSVYPDTWKSALICPLPKVKCPTNLQHYRSISILCLLSKALERIVAEQIIHHLETFNLFDPQQTAYKRGFSTQTALIRVMDEIRHATNRRKVTIAVFFDFTKAFDNVNHRILIHKLRQLNFSCEALRWLYAYLDGRRQAVRDPITGDKSPMRLVTRGVPQGSVLGPLLFVLYLSDFGGILEHCNYNFYADDLLIYLHAEPCDLQSGIRRVNEDIENVVRWADNNQLTLNANKTTSMILGTARYINNIEFEDLPGISVDNTIVPYKESVVYLGVTISQTLSWDKQVAKTVSKVNAALYQLKLCGHLFTQSLRARLVTTLIFPLIDYCCTILTDITGELNLKLQRACNANVRFVCRAERDEHITPYYIELGWLKTNARRKYFVGCLTFNILQSKRPYDLFNTFTFRNVVSERNTRASSDLLALPPCRTELFRRSFRCCAPRLWNEIPSDVRSCSTCNEFKIKFFDYLLYGGN